MHRFLLALVVNAACVQASREFLRSIQRLRSNASPVSSEAVEAFIQYGFESAADRPNMLAETIQLFDLPEGVVQKVNSRYLPPTTYSSAESVVETAEQFSVDAGIEGSYNAFSGSATVSTETASSSNVQQLRVDRVVRAEMFRLTLNAVYPHKYLRDSVKAFLLAETPERIVSKLGEFYAEKLTLGGVFQSIHVKDKTEIDSKASFESQVKAEGSFLVGSVSGNLDTGFSNSQRELLDRVSSSYSVKGGDTTIWLHLRSDNCDQLQDEWVESITESNLYPIQYKLRPLWLLLLPLDPTKGAALQKYLLQKWESERLSIPDYPLAKATCADWELSNSCPSDMVSKPNLGSITNPSHSVCCQRPTGCSGQIVSWSKIDDTKENCRGMFSIAMADQWGAPESGVPFMVGGNRRRQQWNCGDDTEQVDCGGGNCMKVHTNSRRRFTLECGKCTCIPAS